MQYKVITQTDLYRSMAYKGQISILNHFAKLCNASVYTHTSIFYSQADSSLRNIIFHQAYKFVCLDAHCYPIIVYCDYVFK